MMRNEMGIEHANDPLETKVLGIAIKDYPPDEIYYWPVSLTMYMTPEEKTAARKLAVLWHTSQ